MSEREASCLMALGMIAILAALWWIISPPTDQLTGKPAKRALLGVITISFMLGMAFLNDLRR